MSFAKPETGPTSRTELDVDGNPLSLGLQSEGLGRRQSLDYSSSNSNSNSNLNLKRGRDDFDDFRGGSKHHRRSDGPQDYYSARSSSYSNSYSNSYSSSYSNQRSKQSDDPALLDYLVPFRQFADFARHKHRSSSSRSSYPIADLSDDAVREKYAQYKDEFQTRILWKFFNERKRDEWFIEKYHPTESTTLRAQINARKVSESLVQWSQELSAGKFDGLSFDAAAGASDDGFGGVDLKVPKAWEPHALFIKSVPVNILRKEIVDACNMVAGFKHVVLSDPRVDKNYVRLGWIVLEEGTDLDGALKELQGKRITESFSLSLAPQVSQPYRTRLIPVEFNTVERLTHDLELAQRVAKSLDLEAGIENGLSAVQSHCEALIQAWPPVPAAAATLTEEEELDAVRGVVMDTEQSDAQDPTTQSASTIPGLPEKPKSAAVADVPDSPHVAATKKILKLHLDMTIEYLRRVHWYDYYSGVEADAPEDFVRRGWVYLRTTSGSATAPIGPGKPTEFTRLSDRIETRVHLRTLNLTPPDSLTHPSWGGDVLIKQGGQDPVKYVDTLLNSHVAEVDEEKFRCGECSKLFRGREFVTKHLKAKHPSVGEAAEVEILFFNAYVRDFNRVHYLAPAAGGAVLGQGGSGFGSGGGGDGGAGQPYGQGMQQGRYERRGGSMGGGGGYGGGGGQRRPPPTGRDGRPMPVDPRARKTYDDLDGAPVGDVNELNYD